MFRKLDAEIEVAVEIVDSETLTRQTLRPKSQDELEAIREQFPAGRYTVAAYDARTGAPLPI